LTPYLADSTAGEFVGEAVQASQVAAKLWPQLERKPPCEQQFGQRGELG
jgi:hypothetical protein